MRPVCNGGGFEMLIGARCAAALLVLTLASAVDAAEKLPEVDSNGLHLVHHSKLRVVYMRPGSDLGRYDEVILVEAYVAFRKGWEREQRVDSDFPLSKRDLEVAAPDTMDEPGMSATFSGSSGSMTLYAELYDAVSGQLIGRVIDPRSGDDLGGTFVAQNEVTNRAAEDRIVRRWADILADHLGKTVGAAESSKPD